MGNADPHATEAEDDDAGSDGPVALVIEDERWIDAGLGRLAGRAAHATLTHLRAGDCEIVVMGCDDARIAALNAGFRGKAQPTNVLSWPSVEHRPRNAGAAPDLPETEELGDIAISYDTCAREAVAQGKPFDDHVTHLLVHGILHLIGYDHEIDADAALMEDTERAILAGLGLPDPYQ